MLNDSFSPRKPGGDRDFETGIIEESDGEGQAQYEKYRNVSLSQAVMVSNVRPKQANASKHENRFIGSFAAQHNNQRRQKAGK